MIFGNDIINLETVKKSNYQLAYVFLGVHIICLCFTKFQLIFSMLEIFS